jgi:uncharacterized protein DUF1996
MRRLVIALTVLSLGAAAWWAIPAGAQPAPATTPAPAVATGARTAPNFLSVCRYSHRASDDPIVFLGKPGASHSHDFMGNDSTNAYSQYQSMRAATTSCRVADDTAGYWVPTLLDNGVAVAPLRLHAYYRTGGKPGATIRPFPAGLKVVAGDSKATSAQPLRVARWDCGVVGGVRPQATPPTCPAGDQLHVAITFPDCWNGRDLDSADHKSHLSYSVRGACDAAHPVPVPQLTESIVYPTSGGPTFTLSSGGVYSAHADFFNAWNQARLDLLVHDCLNAMVHCGAIR